MDKNNKEKFEEMKQFIRTGFESRVEILRQAMKNAIAGISRLEDTFALVDIQSTKEIPLQTQPPFPRLNRHPVNKGKSKKTAGQRLEAGLVALPDQFTRKDFIDKINSDGHKAIKKGTFGGEFAKLMKSGRIFVLQEKVGSKPGIYSKHKDAG